MGGCRCSYKNCANTTKTRDNLHFFHYPVKQKDRCRQWIENANKPQFYDLDEDQLRNKVICETHFEDCYFPNMQKKRLLQGSIPTLEGDCEPKPVERFIKTHDVQVRPANADGTLFLLETNMQNNLEKVESYIYTNNGQMLPISKCNESADDSMQTIFSEGEIEEINGIKTRNVDSEMFTTLHNENMRMEKEFETYVDVEHIEEKLPTHSYERMKLPQKPLGVSLKMTDDMFSKTVGSTYVKQIKQHSKDIAIIKRILRSKRSCRRPSNSLILNVLKKQIPPSLLSLLSLNINGKCEFSSEDLEFFSTIHSTSPQVYQILSEKYKWNLPNSELFNNITSKNNGHVHCENNQ